MCYLQELNIAVAVQQSLNGSMDQWIYAASTYSMVYMPYLTFCMMLSNPCGYLCVSIVNLLCFFPDNFGGTHTMLCHK